MSSRFFFSCKGTFDIYHLVSVLLTIRKRKFLHIVVIVTCIVVHPFVRSLVFDVSLLRSTDTSTHKRQIEEREQNRAYEMSEHSISFGLHAE